MKNLFYIWWLFYLPVLNVSLKRNTCDTTEKCFRYSFHHKHLTWRESQEWCQKHGTNLVSMETESEWIYLKELIQNLTDSGHMEYYIGLSKASGKWRWLSKNESVPEKNWLWQSNPSGDGECAVMYKNYLGKKGYFNDLSCYSTGNKKIKKGFICERNDDNCDGARRSQKGVQSLSEDPHLPLSSVILVVAIASFDVAMFVVVLFLFRAIWRNYNRTKKV